MVDECLEQGERAGDVVAVVLGRVLHRLADIRIGGEVHHRLGAVLCDHGIEARAIRDVADFERTPAHGFTVAVHEVVENVTPCLI